MNESKGIDRMSENAGAGGSADRIALARWEGEGGKAVREVPGPTTSALEQVKPLETAKRPA